MNEGDVVRIDIDRLVSSIKDMLPHDLVMSSKCYIFKIPAILKKHNENAFIPNAFSIGPLHHGSPELKATEKIKAKYLQGLISRSYSSDTMLRTMVSSIMEVEKEARECYAEAILYNPEQLVQILVIDGCFLIELFRKYTYEHIREEDDPIFSKSYMKAFLNHDLILLENQVPWMVLEILFNLTQDSSDHQMPLILLAINFLENSLLPKATTTWLTYNVQSILKIKGIKHFVDLNRRLSILSNESIGERELLPSASRLVEVAGIKFKRGTSQSIGEWEFLPSARRLMEVAGIKFKRGRKSQSILDIRFKNGILEIPPLVIDETTETVFRNLIAFEQCYPQCKAKINSYVIFLHHLINTSKDLNILCENRIIDTWLNPEDVVELFNKLYQDTYVDHYYYANLCEQVNRSYSHNWARWRTQVWRNFFNTQRAFLSTFAAFTGLVLTFLQTVYTMKK